MGKMYSHRRTPGCRILRDSISGSTDGFEPSKPGSNPGPVVNGSYT